MPTRKQQSARKGNNDKRKARDWFRENGYDCEYTEVLKTIFAGPGRVFYKKNDLFASDGVAMNGKEIIFWNSKSKIKNMLADLKHFEEFKYPEYVTTAIIVWKPRKKIPYILRKVNGEITCNFSNGDTEEEFKPFTTLKDIDFGIDRDVTIN